MSDAIRQLHDVANALADSGLRTVKTNDLCVAVYAAIDELERLRAREARLREVLTFYAEAWACRTTKSRLGGVAGLEWRPKNDLLEDCGNAARAALAEKGEK